MDPKNLGRAYLLMIALMVASTPTWAGPLSGTYQLSSPCQVTLNGFLGQTEILIPAGKIVVTENLPWVVDSEAHPAIIFQTENHFSPLLYLGVGMVKPWSFGPQRYSEGTYYNGYLTFEEKYSSRLVDGDFPVTVRLERIFGGDMLLTAVDRSVSADAPEMVCSFARIR